MAAKNPQLAADKWLRNIQGATQSMVDGSNAVTQNPATAAIAAKPRMVARWTAAMSQGGKWDSAMSAVTLDKWRSNYQQKGIPRVGQGAAAAHDKVANVLSQIITYQQAGLAKIKSMPNNNISDAVAKSGAWIQYMSGFKKK